MTSGMLERSQTLGNIYSGYYADGHNADVVKKRDMLYQQSLSPWQMFFWEALIDRKVYVGDQRYLNQYTGLSYEHLKFVFNVSMPVANMVCGRQRKHRKATRIMPTQGSSDHTASQATKVIQHCYEHDKTYHKFSDAFEEGAGITGLGLLHSWMDYRFDPVCGDLRTEVFSPDMLLMDPFWRELDLSDCQFIMTRKYLSKLAIKEMLPARDHDIDMLNDSAYFDTKFTFMPQQYNVRRKGVLAYDEFWYQDKRKATFLVDPETYESIEIDEDSDRIAEIRQQYPQVVIVKEFVPTVKLAIIVNNVCFYDGPNPLGIDKYPFTPFVGYHDLANNNYSFRYQGIIRNIRDPQYLYSNSKQHELDLFAAQLTGVEGEEFALESDHDAFKLGPGPVRFMKKGRLNAIVDKPGANINPANFQATAMLKDDVQSNAGVTPEMLGQTDGGSNDVALLEKIRQDAGLTTLQKLFDTMDLSQAYAGQLHWEIIQKNYTYGKIKQILQEQPTNEFKDKSFQKYNSVVSDAPLTATTRQLAFREKYTLWKDGLPIPMEDLIADLTIQDKDKMLAKMQKQQQQQQQMEQQAAMLQMENQRIVNDSLQSKAMSDRSLAHEREGKLQLEKASIITKLDEGQAAKARATLDTIKAANEMQEMNVNNFDKVIRLIHDIQAGQHSMAMAESDQQFNRDQANQNQQNVENQSKLKNKVG